MRTFVNTGFRFFYNSDLSGEVFIQDDASRDASMGVPGTAILAFVAEHVRRERIAELEQQTSAQVLGVDLERERGGAPHIDVAAACSTIDATPPAPPVDETKAREYAEIARDLCGTIHTIGQISLCAPSSSVRRAFFDRIIGLCKSLMRDGGLQP